MSSIEEALEGLAALEVFSQDEKLYSNNQHDLSLQSKNFNIVDQTSRSFRLGPLKEMVVFDGRYEVTRSHDSLLVCSKAKKLNDAYLAQLIYESSAS